ncbi:OmpA family protein [Rhodosalinus sp. FB01]|uniref:OmpA family protein n=1 Tax=Rhodosalinus sp. FB01 TaxID=3239194 RepID=UPI0035247E2C
MRLKPLALPVLAFTVAGLLAALAAVFSVDIIEKGSEEGVRTELTRAGLHWAEVDANGLQLYLIGTAPNEAERFRALSTAGRVVDAARVIDNVNVAEASRPAPPRFSIEILRNEDGVSVIGLVPAATDREGMVARLEGSVAGGSVSDLMEVADYPTPEGWDDALDFGLSTLKRLPRAKISIEAGAVAITAMSDSAAEKRSLEAEFARQVPDTLRLALDISAPRPVISPFTLRFVLHEGGARFDACSASTEEGRARILAAAAAAGMDGKGDCRIGLGVPSSAWPEAAERAIAALAELDGGSVTITDADVALVAAEGTDPALFERVSGELGADLPDIFALDAVLPEVPDETDTGPREFIATLSPEGSVQLRGRISSETNRTIADSFARAGFGSAAVYTAAVVDDSLPAEWQVRVLAGLEALARLANGAVTIRPDSIRVRGETGKAEASAEIASLLSEKLGASSEFSIEVAYREALDPEAALPTPAECVAMIDEITEGRKINFEPGSATLDSAARLILDDIAEVLRDCGPLPLEIAGHTDSQGRESMNLDLSQQRAEAVLAELRDRRVLTSSFVPRGYGESDPIADNGTEAGRETNRRIEFSLLPADPVSEVEAVLERLAADDDRQDADAEPAAGESQ